MKRILLLLLLSLLGSQLSAQESCMQPDVNCDGYVNVNDLLGLLGYFGEEDLDGDGIWDSQDDCVDDGCGVCDGPGPQVLAVDTITFTVDSVFIEAINEWYVFEVPDTIFTFVCSNPGCTNPAADNYDPYASENDGSCEGNACVNVDPVVFDDFEYNIVGIGDQCWFAENLRTEHFANGSPIPGNLSNLEWFYTATTSAQAIYGSAGEPNADDQEMLALYGRLYNANAVHHPAGICPSGWHVPTDDEWKELEMSMGMSAIQADSIGYRGTDEGTKLMDDVYWNGTNQSGFSALPGGEREEIGHFIYGGYGFYWTSTFYGSAEVYTWAREFWGLGGITRAYEQNRHGRSVRCLKDD